MIRFGAKFSASAALALLAVSAPATLAAPQSKNFGAFPERDVVLLSSPENSSGVGKWQMLRAEKAAGGDVISKPDFTGSGWSPAVVPGTVLTNLVRNKVYPEPYFGLNNVHDGGHIPDISQVGTPFYTYWFRTSFNVPTSYKAAAFGCNWMVSTIAPSFG